MKLLFTLLLVVFALNATTQNTFIKNQGFGVNKVSGGGLIAEFNNHYYFSFGLKDLTSMPNEYVIGKYDTLGNFISKAHFGTALFSPALRKSQMSSDSTFCSLFNKVGNPPFYSVIQKNELNGSFVWNTSLSQFYFDFICDNDSVYAIGSDTASNGSIQQAIFHLNSKTGQVIKKTYFVDIPEFQIVTNDSNFKVIEITAIDSSLFILINRIEDSAKFIFQFDVHFQYINHFEIEKDAYWFLDNSLVLAVHHHWRTSDFIAKGRAVIYNHFGNILWKLEEFENNLNYQYSPGSINVKGDNLIFNVLNYNKVLGPGSAWTEAIVTDFTGNIKRRVKLESDSYDVSISTLLPIKNGYLMQGRLSDYETHIIKSDTCFNAVGTFHPGWVLNSDNCGFINSSDEIFFKEKEFTIYPNPTNSIINILGDSQWPRTINLLNLKGSIIQTYIQKQTIDISDLKQGIYILELEGLNGTIERHKIIKK